jgi:uncharacterized protein YnzC (UPF0291/DUF896 family)
MLSNEALDRIGELSRKQRSVGLTVAEQAEQHALRRAYLERFRVAFKAQLAAEGLVPTSQKSCDCDDPNCWHSHHHHDLPH